MTAVQGAGLGWRISHEAGPEKRIEEGRNSCIVELETGEKRYCLNAFPMLSPEEEGLLAGVAALFQMKGVKTSRQGLKEFFKLYCLQNLVLLDRAQAEYLLLALERQLFGFGPLDFLLEDSSLEEIAVIGTGALKPVQVFHRRHGWLAANFFFSSESHVRDLANRMAMPSGRRLSLNSPVLNAVLADGSRLSAAISPVCFSGASLTIRKFRKQTFTPAELVLNQTFSAELMALLWVAMQCDCSLLVVGNTGSGKTSSLNALLSFVPGNERIVLVEETPEVRLQHRHFVKLNVVKDQDVGMQELIVESLRMRPDRIVVGEVRNREETAAFIDTMLAGQGKGSYATFHGQSVSEAMNRMRCLGVLDLDLAAIDLVLVQRRWNIMGAGGNRETRRVVEAAELLWEGNGLKFNRLFGFDYESSRLVKLNESVKIFEKAKRSFSLGKGRQTWLSELKKRQRFLSEEGGKMPMEKFFEKVNSHWGGQ